MRWRGLFVIMVAVLAAGVFPATGQTVPAAAYAPPICTLVAPATNGSSRCAWQGISLQSPGNESAIATPDPTVACNPTTTAECEDTTVVVPAGVSPSTLYVKVSWQHPTWSAYMYVIDPNGELHGQGGIGCDASSFEKGCGNQTTLPFDELVIADPAPGKWTVRVAAVSMHDEPYSGLVALTHSHPLEYAKKQLAQLTSELTRNEDVNIVFAGWQPTDDELTQMKAALTTEFLPAVASKQGCDGSALDDTGASGLVQHQTAHCTATADPTDANYFASGNVPYFEPLRYLPQYHFLAADDTWTRDLFTVMRDATTQDHELSDGRVPATAETGPFKKAYLDAYNAAYGANRGSKLVTDTSTVDEIDGVTVEQWVQDHRLDTKYAKAFTNIETSAQQSAAFINPDPTATRDPFWNANGTAAPNLDRDPQGLNTGVTFFLLDTFTPTYADDYFRPEKYHSWWTAEHVLDPDFKEAAFTDNGRGWGGRYRFHILDLGAAPTTYERANWLTAAVTPDGGSAAFDPPIWDYRNSPQWNGSLPLGPLQAGGNTIGSVLGWEVTQGLAFKYIGGYLYRPIPNDVYVLATSTLTDHYSLPSEGDLYAVDMTKVAQLDVARTALSSAAPYANFQAGPDQTKTLGCAPSRAAVIGNPTQVGVLTQGLVTQVPDPKCGLTPENQPDAFQQAIEDAKANGSSALVNIGGAPAVPTYSVNQDYIRDYVDLHRPDYAPLYDGAFTVPVVNIMFEHAYTVALPLVVGGIAENVNGGEGWGQIDNVNDQYIMAAAIDCPNSSPVAPGCNGIPDTFRHDVGLTYTMEHESAHFLGLNHPHDGAVTVGTTNGQWHYYYQMLKWLYDVSASPTTYAGTYDTYETIDQERLMAGHAAEYLKQSEDWLADAYFMDAVTGRSSISSKTRSRLQAAMADRAQATVLFQRGDYLHAMYGMRNAALHAKGVNSKAVPPHLMSLDQAAHDSSAIFRITPQKAYVTSAPVNAEPLWWTTLPPPAPASTSSTAAVPVSAKTTGLTYNFCHIRY